MQENTKQEPKITNDFEKGGPTTSTPEVKEELSKVGSNPKRNILVMASMVMGFAVMGYNLLAPIFSNKEDVDKTPDPAPNMISSPSTANADLQPIPQIPEPPKLVDPSPPSPPPPLAPPAPLVPPPSTKVDIDDHSALIPPLPPAPSLPPVIQPPVAIPSIPKTSQNNAANFDRSSDKLKERAEAKRKSSIVLVGGAAPVTQSALEKEQDNDFKKRGDLAYVLGQGKVMDAVIETAINSDFKGEIRAIISRDVYAENAKTILIPKGTRVFGAFTADAASGRVSVKWTKINLESGYTLTMDAIGVDSLGRGGAQGRIDNKYKEQMTNALLTSAFNVGIATGLDKIIPPVTSTATAAQTASGVAGIITQASVIASDQNNQTPPTYAVQQIPGGGTDNGSFAKINAICALQSQITDQTSTAYTQMGQACITARATSANPSSAQGALNVLISTITGLASTSAAAAVTNATPTQTQEASKQAFTDISTAAKNMMGQQQFQPTVTIDQGTKIKIYVNKDYVFPKNAIHSTKVIH